MIKHVMVALVLVIGLSGMGNASWSCDPDATYNNAGFGTFSGSGINEGYSLCWIKSPSSDPNFYVYYAGTITFCNGTCSKLSAGYTCYADYPQDGLNGQTGDSISGDFIAGCHPSYSTAVYGANDYSFYCDRYSKQSWTITISEIIIDQYKISGNVSCTAVKLYHKDTGGAYTLINYTDYVTPPTYYEFAKLLNGSDYKVVMGTHEYLFTVNGTDLTHNWDDCSHTQYWFEESCGNLIPDSEGYYCENWIGGGGICYPFHESDGILDISNTSAASIEVYTNTFIGQTRWLIDPVVSNTTYVLQNPTINWGLKVIVQNESDGTLIDGAMVKVDQDCYCTSGYSTRQKMTVNGMVQFGDMSLQDASLFVMKYGYKICDENSTGYSSFLSGRSNFSSKTWLVKLAPSTSNNSSTFYEVNNKVDIHFRDVNGNRTSKILDTDINVYLYYENNNTDNEAMTLKFQSSSTHTYFSDELSWTIAHDDIGHKTIANSYFTPCDYSYRAVIYNDSIYGWNITIPLTVRNATKEDEQHYKNLTTNLWFMYADDGKVDYRDDMKVAIHAQSNNITLMTMDVELWIDGVYSGCKNLTATDFTGADFPYYYVWDPVFDYVSGSNYSVRMYGFDRTLLETDYIECITDNITRKNKLTIIVKNQDGINIDNAYIYLEGYGSTATGSNYYASFEGLDNGYYRFKATKPNYTGAGWSDITILDDDEIVTYVLSWVGSGSDSTIKQQKMDDITLRNLYIPLMMLLLILIVFGGFKSVI